MQERKALCSRGNWVPEGRLAKIFGPVCLDFRPEIDPGTPLDRRGSRYINLHQKSAPEAIPKPFRGTQKLPPDYLQVHRKSWFWIWLKIGRFRGLGGPRASGTPLDRQGPPGTSICTKSQPRRSNLRPCRRDFSRCPKGECVAEGEDSLAKHFRAGLPRF